MDNLSHQNSQNHLQRYSGGLIGVVLSLDDPENLGRIQVAAPTIDPQKPLPNGDKGWISCMQRFSGQESPGGSFDPIAIGDQVILLPLAGDLRACICLGVLLSRVDPPSPYVSRQKGIYGTHSPGQIIRLEDDKQGRSLSVHPTGIVETNDSFGNKIIETRAGAKLSLGESGAIDLENQQSFYSLDKSGNIQLGNDKSSFSLDRSGAVTMDLADSSKIKFSGFGAEVEGQKDEVAIASHEVQENLAGVTGIVKFWIRQLTAFSEDLKSSDEETVLNSLYELDRLLEIIAPALKTSQNGLESLQKIQTFDPEIIGEKIVGQINQFRNLNFSTISQTFAQGVDLDATDIEGSLGEILGEKLLGQIAPDWEQLKSALTAANKGQHLELILASIYPNKLDSLIGSGLHRALNFIDSLQLKIDDLGLEAITEKIDQFSEIAESGTFNLEIRQINSNVANIPIPASLAGSLAMVAQLKAAIAQLEKYKSQIKEKLGDVENAIADIDKLREDSRNLALDFGNKILGLVQDAESKVAGVSGLLDLVVELSSQTTHLLNLQQEEEDGLTDRETISADLLPSLERIIVDLESIGSAEPVIKQLGIELSEKTTGGGIVANQDEVRLSADSGGLKGSLLADKNCSALIAPGGNQGLGTKVVAEETKLSLLTPGADKQLGSKIEASTEKISFHSPGADLGLGNFFEINQKEAYFYAPGGQQDLGAAWSICQDELQLYAPGGQSGTGSNIGLTSEEVRISAAGGTKSAGSQILADTEKVAIYAPGGKNQAGSRIILDPADLLLKTGGISGAFLSLGQTGINCGLPLAGGRMQLQRDKVNIALGLSTGIRLTPMGITLYAPGVVVSLNGAGVRINGVPLVPFGNLW